MAARPALKPRKQPRQARSRETVAAILDAAAQVFQRRGYAGGTTDRIAERAGVSVGSLYQYFPNKDAILVALAERHITEGFALARRLLEQADPVATPLAALLETFVDAVIALHAHEPELHRVLFEEAPLPRAVRQLLADGEETLRADVQALVEAAPEVRVPHSGATAYVLIQTVEGLVHGYILHPPATVSRRRFTTEVVRMLHAYLTA